MIVSRTPFRLSLFGGGTDYPRWYRQHGGKVLGMAIDKYCYITIRHLPPFFEHRHRIVYSRIELVREVDEIIHPAVRAVFKEMGIFEGLEVHHDGDLPARSGLGSSSSFTCGLLNALYALQGRMVTRQHLAEETIRIEQEVIGEAVGSQDQIWAAYGGLNRIDFRPDGSFEVTPVIVPARRRQELERSLMLFFTGLSRNASEVAAKKIDNLDRRAAHLERMAAMVEEAQAILQSGSRPLADIGRLLHEGWMLKRELSEGVTTPHIDEIYEAAREAGAVGGKLLGAGGGGFMAFFVEPARRQSVRNRLRHLISVPFQISPGGSRIMLYEPTELVER
ncbi:MAG: GHMP kinase [Thalassobaculales bacterium]